MIRLANKPKTSKYSRTNKPRLSDLPEAVLHEIAFALEMTRRIRETIETGTELPVTDVEWAANLRFDGF